MDKKSVFEEGDMVTWESQSGGYEKSKTGKVVHVFEAGDYPINYWRDNCPSAKRVFDRATPVTQRTYLVSVQRTPRCQPVLYLPNPNRLFKA